MRVAAIDCGTNSIRLLVLDGATELHREMRIVRLGQGVDRTGRLAPEALERTRAALAEYAATIASFGAERVRFVATSATRDARNRDEFAAIVERTVGVPPEVVTGSEEAELSYRGAVGTLPGVDGTVLLADLGGGSTELVLGTDPLRSSSMDVGSVRMTERHLRDDPPTADQVAAVVADVRAALDTTAVSVPMDTGAPLVGVAGTVTTVAALALDLDEYDRDAVHGARIGAARVAGITDRLLRSTRDDRAAMRVIHPGRVDVITAGALVLRTLMERIGAAEIIASEHDILDGIALSISRPETP